MFTALRRPDVLVTTLAAGGILLVTMGARQSLGLFVDPLSASTGLGIAAISLALAVGQFSWGAIQPVAGAMADRYGTRPVLVAGIGLLALGISLTPFMSSELGLIFSLGLLSAIGSGAGSFSILVGATAQHTPIEARGAASGIINAGGSAGQFIFAPVLQFLIQTVGWKNALWSLAVMILAALPLAGKMSGPPGTAPVRPVTAGHGSLAQTLRQALTTPSYLLLNAGFFTCGFHIAFLVTHLPGEVSLCGLPPAVASWSLSIIGLTNILGSLFAGWCIGRFASKNILVVLYLTRAVLIGVYLVLPRTEAVYYLFAAGLGFTWLATVPPTAGVTAKLFGVRYLSTLFGLTLLSHQVGGFLGAYLGGLALSRFGDYGWMWYADMTLAALAALVNIPIRETPAAGVPVTP